MAEGREEYEVNEILEQRQKNGKTEYLIRWKDYRPEDDTWEPLENLKNAREALHDFRSRGRDQEKVGYHVTAVTQGTTEANQNKLTWSKPGLICLTINLQEGMNQQFEPVRSGQDSGSGTPPKDINAQLMGKLCKWVLVLIKHKMGADVHVSDRMVRALKEWLRRHGISIYTESLL
jgi:hypothetical protein